MRGTTMSPNETPKKLIVELRFKPTLRAYEQLDPHGIELAGRYPDWERTPLSLELRNRREHRRLFMSGARTFYEIDGVPDPRSDLRLALDEVERFCQRIDVAECTRVGVRHLFAVDLGMTLPALADRIYAKFYANDDRIAKALDADFNDVQYVVDFGGTEKQSYKVRMGPMEIGQWLQLVSYERDNFERGKEESASFAKFIESLPKTFLYVDVDAGMPNCPLSDARPFCIGAQEKISEMLKSVLGLLRGG
jgi:hypothetical protein